MTVPVLALVNVPGPVTVLFNVRVLLPTAIIPCVRLKALLTVTELFSVSVPLTC